MTIGVWEERTTVRRTAAAPILFDAEKKKRRQNYRGRAGRHQLKIYRREEKKGRPLATLVRTGQGNSPPAKKKKKEEKNGCHSRPSGKGRTKGGRLVTGAERKKGNAALVAPARAGQAPRKESLPWKGGALK